MHLKNNPILKYRFTYNFLWLIEHFTSIKSFEKKRLKISSKIASKITLNENERISNVKIETEISAKDFHKKYFNNPQPVVFKGAAKKWPAFNKWNPDFFKDHYGQTKVILFEASVNSLDSNEISETSLVNFNKFIEMMQSGSKEYVRFSPILDKNPELLEDIDNNWLLNFSNSKSKNTKHQLFIGGKNTSTSIHSAIGSNLFVQVHGRKEWYIYDTFYNSLVQPKVDRSVFFRSNVSAKKPDEIFKKARGWRGVLEPGDILYNPPFFWHEVHNLDTTVGFGYRWFSFNEIIKSSFIKFILTITATNPSIRKAKKLEENFAKVYEQVLSKSLK